MATVIVLKASDADRDDVWVENKSGYFSIHTKETLYRITEGKMVWTFPGPAGRYGLELLLFAKANGPAPCWVTVDGREVWRGETPLPVGQDFIYCCGKKNPRDCDRQKGKQELLWVDAQTTVEIDEGSRIEHWGRTAYHCQPPEWKEGEYLWGYGGGTYSGFARMRWTLVGE